MDFSQEFIRSIERMPLDEFFEYWISAQREDLDPWYVRNMRKKIREVLFKDKKEEK